MTEEKRDSKNLNKKRKSRIRDKYVPDFLSDGTKFIYTILGRVLGLLIVIILPLVFFRAAQETDLGRFFTPATNDEVKLDPRNVFVSDNAKVLKPQTKKEILEINRAFEKLPKKPQLMVITVKELPKGQKIEAYTNKLANKFGVGDKKENTGVVYLLAQRDHQARLEVGYGLEGTIPDAMTDLITDETVKDYYRKNDFDSGIRLVSSRINELITTGELSYANPLEVGSPNETELSAFLGSVQSSFIWWIVFGILAGALWYLRKAGAYFVARLRVDEIGKHYFSDIKAIDPSLDDNDIMMNRPAVNDAKNELKSIISKNRISNRPDYYDMKFAFGSGTTGYVADNVYIQDEDFKKKSMYLAHQDDWFNSSKFTLFKFFDHPFVKEVDKYEAKDQRNFVMNKFERFFWHIIKFFSSKLFWITFIVLGLFGPEDFEGNILLFRIPKDFMVMIFESFGPLFQSKSTFWQFAVVAGLASILFLGYFFGVNLQMTARRKFYLDKMYRDFAGDLFNTMTEAKPLSKEQIIKALKDGSEIDKLKPAQNNLRTQLKELEEANSENKSKRIRRGLVHVEVPQTGLPDYYDFVFAFGWLTAAEFLTVNVPSKKFKKTNLFINHEKDWFRYLEEGSFGSGTGSGSDSHSSGSGGSFGGGSFGGGGGTSSW